MLCFRSFVKSYYKEKILSVDELALTAGIC